MLVRMWSNRSPHLLLVRIEGGRATLEDNSPVSYDPKHSLIIQHRNLTPWYLLKEMKAYALTKTYTYMFIATLSLIIQTGKKSRYLNRQIDDKTVAHPHKGIIPLLTQTNRPKSLWKDLEEFCIQRGKQKKPIWKGNMLCDSKSMASFWDRSKDANRKGINRSYVVEGKGGINR